MIPERYQFSTFGEFYTKRTKIRVWYNRLSDDAKCVYRYYIYSRLCRRGMKEKHCDDIFEWLSKYHSNSTFNRIHREWLDENKEWLDENEQRLQRAEK